MQSRFHSREERERETIQDPILEVSNDNHDDADYNSPQSPCVYVCFLITRIPKTHPQTSPQTPIVQTRPKNKRRKKTTTPKRLRFTGPNTDYKKDFVRMVILVHQSLPA